MRHDDQPVDLLVAGIGKREHRPMVAGLACAHLDAARNAVGAGRDRNLNAVAVGARAFGGGGQVDRRGVGADIDGIDRVRRGSAASHNPAQASTAATTVPGRLRQVPVRVRVLQLLARRAGKIPRPLKRREV